jgi:hypothetical protein
MYEPGREIRHNQEKFRGKLITSLQPFKPCSRTVSEERRFSQGLSPGKIGNVPAAGGLCQIGWGLRKDPSGVARTEHSELKVAQN